MPFRYVVEDCEYTIQDLDYALRCEMCGQRREVDDICEENSHFLEVVGNHGAPSSFEAFGDWRGQYIQQKRFGSFMSLCQLASTKLDAMLQFAVLLIYVG